MDLDCKMMLDLESNQDFTLNSHQIPDDNRSSKQKFRISHQTSHD